MKDKYNRALVVTDPDWNPENLSFHCEDAFPQHCEYNGRLLINRSELLDRVDRGKFANLAFLLKKFAVSEVVLLARGHSLGDKTEVLTIVADHINLTGDNPLIGKNFDELGPRFPDMTDLYTPSLRQEMSECLQSRNEGVLAGVHFDYGPGVAEKRFYRQCGAEYVSSRLVHEAILLRHSGLKLAGILLLDTELDFMKILKQL